MKPSFRVVELQHKCQLLAGSNDPQGVPYWGGEGNAPAFDWVEKGNQFGGWDVE
ncbi:MAG: hypothetical protein J6M01_04760 [Prevotella sp.]|nr:hypothetical protein [Prevotella sp.]